MYTSQIILIANILISINSREEMFQDACDVRSNQDTEFNIKRRCCKVCWDEACDVDDNKKNYDTMKLRKH